MMKENHEDASQANNAKLEREDTREKKKETFGSEIQERATSRTASAEEESAYYETGVETDDLEGGSNSGDWKELVRQRTKRAPEVQDEDELLFVKALKKAVSDRIRI